MQEITVGTQARIRNTTIQGEVIEITRQLNHVAVKMAVPNPRYSGYFAHFVAAEHQVEVV